MLSVSACHSNGSMLQPTLDPNELHFMLRQTAQGPPTMLQFICIQYPRPSECTGVLVCIALVCQYELQCMARNLRNSLCDKNEVPRPCSDPLVNSLVVKLMSL